ncbi:RNA polymerase sigma-70 factor, ECF subfamily [Reichenbachiella faecimaris]|uniref:RNA polymerase sigma-70 factor, ECF subfamily n=1 Tax=Reichenbachiella faecimaris TaxID=692418 RepID=A0A1W2GDH2_REIFA|nr:RNA polymerase sigma factor [Reichenbachiella faecimaris]SMD34695.1 RNA polymerase sigma-70 factor, ECF subfamily [Reichenbachiella faecimaris]
MNKATITPYESEFLEFKDELLSFVFRLVSNRALAEDLVHDTYLRMAEKIDTFRQESSFKTWVFTIAHNLAKNQFAKQKRWREDAQQINAKLHINSEEMFDQMRGVYESKPDKSFELKEHITYCFNCMAKTLVVDQQVCLWLKNVYDFKVSEIMTITGLSEGKVKHAIADARKHLTRIFDEKCAFVSQKGTCHQCSSLKGILNPEQDEQSKANQIKMVREGSNPDKEKLLDLRMELVKNMNPLEGSSSHLHTYFLENSPKWVEMALSKERT